MVLELKLQNEEERLEAGESVCINGVCLTVLPRKVKPSISSSESKNKARFFLQQETLNLTTFGSRLEGSEEWCNIERALKLGARLSGHLVLGHVHGVSIVTSMECHTNGSRDIWLRLPNSSIADQRPNVQHKGSIAFDGVSLTIAQIRHVGDDQTEVRVSLIPYTIEHTTLQFWVVGQFVNVEFATTDHENSMWMGLPYHDDVLSFGNQDERWMAEAIMLSEKGRQTAPPNPWVGCVIIGARSQKGEQQVLGMGFHSCPGEPHAEIMALVNALCARYTDLTRFEALNLLNCFDEKRKSLKFLSGSTLYVSLEPCVSFSGKRTTSCASLIASLGIERVCIALEDPDLRVQGKGIECLRNAGVNVVLGVGSEAATLSLLPYLKHRLVGLPFVVQKVAISMDGSVAAADKTSK